MSIEVRVPTLGESVSEATVATWFKKPGDHVAVDEMLCELETDKVTVEVPSPVAGTVTEIVAPEGATVSVEALLAQISEGDVGKIAVPKKQQPNVSTDQGVAVMVPTLGESVSEATVAEWFKQPGDSVAQDEMLCELETDKVSVEVPAPSAGILGEILAHKGSTVLAGSQLATIGGTDTKNLAKSIANPTKSTAMDIETPPQPRN